MFQIAVAGNVPDDNKIVHRLDEQLGQVRAFLSPDGRAEEVRLVFAPSFGSEGWWEWMRKTDCTVTGYRIFGDERRDNLCDRTIYVDTPVRGKVGEMILDHVDLLLMVWSEDVTELEGASWELLRIARRKHVPCLWISAQTRRLYWVEDTLYTPYKPEKLQAVCRMTVEASTEPLPVQEKRIPLLPLGTRLYKKFLQRYKAAPVVMKSKEDHILQDTFVLTAPFDDGEEMRRTLLDKYRAFDSTAIKANDKYQAVLYWRAILPFIMNIFLAFGFYTVSVLKVFDRGMEPVFGMIAGVGFLISAFLNLYVFQLSRSKVIHSYQHAMIHNRRMAELLRVVLHFAPFGINLDMRKMSGQDPELGAAVRRMVGESEASVQEITREDAVSALEYVEELLSDQIVYHTKSRERYSKVVKSLERVSMVFFWIGFGIVISRAGLQFVMAFMGSGAGSFFGQKIGDGVVLKDFASSIFNMLAMIVPAWAAYFAAKLSLGNFRFNRDNHERMMEELGAQLRNIEALREAEEQLSSEAMQDIGEGIAEIMLLKDNTLWANKYKGTQVSRL